jgi:phospholipid/cholesterol/gamma-HCH transport system substrate-binding protein
MKRKERALEVKVGVFLLVGFLILLYMSLRVSKLERIQGEHYFALFPTVSGLTKGAPVEVAGVVVGRVEEIKLEGKMAKVRFVLSKGVVLFEDAKATLRTHGALGDKFIEIDPGTSQKEPLKPGEVILSTYVTPDLDQLFLSLQKTAQGFAEMGEALRDLMGEKETREAVKELVINLRDSSREFKGFLVQNRTRLDNTISNLESFSKSLNPLLDKASSGLDKMQSTLSSLEEVSQNVKEGKGTLGKLMTDETLYNDLKQSASEFKLFAERMNRGEGTLGKLLTDDKLYTEAEKTLKKVQKAMEGIEEQTPISILGTLAGFIF